MTSGFKDGCVSTSSNPLSDRDSSRNMCNLYRAYDVTITQIVCPSQKVLHTRVNTALKRESLIRKTQGETLLRRGYIFEFF